SLQPNRGCYVAKPTVKEARDIFFTRRLIEDQLVRRLVERVTAKDVKLLRDHIAAERNTHVERNYENMVRYAAEFHLLIGDIADMPVLAGVLRQLIAKSSLLKASYQRWVHVERGASEHAVVVDAIEKKDVEEAARVMREHLLEIETELDLDNPVGIEMDLKAIFGEIPVKL
ncbi:MAG: GntR family transcriptional regulator, partial [Alphaproteobacteria bacterium]|nr:GntR family transcriptional regulator [Alphaproteobacteria bacterium]